MHWHQLPLTGQPAPGAAIAHAEQVYSGPLITSAVQRELRTATSMLPGRTIGAGACQYVRQQTRKFTPFALQPAARSNPQLPKEMYAYLKKGSVVALAGVVRKRVAHGCTSRPLAWAPSTAHGSVAIVNEVPVFQARWTEHVLYGSAAPGSSGAFLRRRRGIGTVLSPGPGPHPQWRSDVGTVPCPRVRLAEAKHCRSPALPSGMR